MQKQHGSLGPEARGGMFKREKMNPHGCSLAPGQREREDVWTPRHIPSTAWDMSRIWGAQSRGLFPEREKNLRDKGCKEPHCCTEQEIGVCSPRRQVCHVLPRMTEGKADSTLTHPKQNLVRFLEVAKLKIPHFQGGERGGMLNQDVSTHTLPRGTEQLVSQPSENPWALQKRSGWKAWFGGGSCGCLRSPDSAFTQMHRHASVFPDGLLIVCVSFT